MVSTDVAARFRAEDLIGTVIPGGTFEFEGYESWIGSHAFYAAPDERVHPMMNYVGLHQGLGIGIGELFALFGSDIDDGPMLAGCTMVTNHDLRVGHTYTVRGSVVNVTRKEGRAFGAFDIIDALYAITDETGTVVTEITNHYAVKRGDDE